ncbi:Prolipoprotein diacylglyceryl transferase [Tepidanaerobacter acetatoxydans Re1]|uniref:Phosphatidylglycerol--prolipoprotein diacylglyceryl transferase n=1 Tax=Tepidanaerobacter acetatoxydans (strain DSM 21804 / JCM 16047 / Re1) TaxID=1209989 RepID=F4LU41_TEPAE|nr:prolipoprotein diacylglyceryl transferase [Tepidanaerobacter acetatoxydans]AEE90567.1 Prolipoprotein diacylglyceryl transferase [Tepidanaerobacter acetatoxydans Re1]CCP25083.1 Prolipoprotein diacylglyceryl transferase [Tepidanaerobacter acetatoxydans Re1]
MLLDLSPYAFKIGPIAVHWYGIFMAISFLVGSYHLLKMGKKKGFDEDFLLNLAMTVIIAGIIGARLMFVLCNYPQWFISAPLNVIKIWEGGLAWHGGLLGGLLAGWSYCKKNGVNPYVLADWTVVGLSFGYFLVRIANIFNQEVLGRMTQFSFGRWPAQLIGSSIGLILLIRYIYLQKKEVPPGYQFCSFIWYHQLLRAVIEETVRENPVYLIKYVNPRWGLGVVTLTQWFTPLVMGIAYYMYKSSNKGNVKSDS